MSVERMADLAASYMVAGFVHGVLNTDNMNVTGESFDYGPLALATDLGSGLYRRLFRPCRALCLWPPARGAALELRAVLQSRCGC